MVVLSVCAFLTGGCAGKTVDGSGQASGGACMISGANYDQSCHVDTDCQEVTPGDYCTTGCLCGASAISVRALAQFDSDVAKTPVGSGAVQSIGCPCPPPAPPPAFGPCCHHGTCQVACSPPADTLPACVDAGGTC